MLLLERRCYGSFIASALFSVKTCKLADMNVRMPFTHNMTKSETQFHAPNKRCTMFCDI